MRNTSPTTPKYEKLVAIGGASPRESETQLSNEKNPGWLGYIGDEKLPSFLGSIIN